MSGSHGHVDTGVHTWRFSPKQKEGLSSLVRSFRTASMRNACPHSILHGATRRMPVKPGRRTGPAGVVSTGVMQTRLQPLHSATATSASGLVQLGDRTPGKGYLVMALREPVKPFNTYTPVYGPLRRYLHDYIGGMSIVCYNAQNSEVFQCTLVVNLV